MAETTLSKCSEHMANPSVLGLVSFQCDLRSIFEELNEYSGMGLTASELATLTKGNFFSNFVDCCQVGGGKCDTCGTLLQSASVTADNFGAGENGANWDQEQPKGVTDNIYSSQNSQLSVQQKKDPVRLCKDYPDCDASSTVQGPEDPCYVISIRPKWTHDILQFFNQGNSLVGRLNKFLSSSKVRLSLLKTKPEFHISGRKSPRITIMVTSWLQNILRPTVKDLRNSLVGPGELPCANAVTADDVTNLDASSASTADSLEETKPRQLVKDESVKVEQSRRRRPLLPTPPWPLPLLSTIGAPDYGEPFRHSQQWKTTSNQCTRKLPELMSIRIASNTWSNLPRGSGHRAPKPEFVHSPNRFIRHRGVTAREGGRERRKCSERGSDRRRNTQKGAHTEWGRNSAGDIQREGDTTKGGYTARGRYNERARDREGRYSERGGERGWNRQKGVHTERGTQGGGRDSERKILQERADRKGHRQRGADYRAHSLRYSSRSPCLSGCQYRAKCMSCRCGSASE